jgi:hypothetical protein
MLCFIDIWQVFNNQINNQFIRSEPIMNFPHALHTINNKLVPHQMGEIHLIQRVKE